MTLRNLQHFHGRLGDLLLLGGLLLFLGWLLLFLVLVAVLIGLLLVSRFLFVPLRLLVRGEGIMHSLGPFPLIDSRAGVSPVGLGSLMSMLSRGFTLTNGFDLSILGFSGRGARVVSGGFATVEDSLRRLTPQLFILF